MSASDANPLIQLDEEPGGAMHLLEDEAGLLKDECDRALAQPLSEPACRLYEQIREAAGRAEIPASLLDPVQALLEVGLETGRIRQIHLAHGEMAANRLFARLPRGKAYRQSVGEVNQALRTLAGRTMVEASFQARGPGSCILTLDTGSRRITIGIQRSGLSVENVEAVV